MMVKCARMKALKPKYEILTCGIKNEYLGRTKCYHARKARKHTMMKKKKRKIRMDDEHSNG